MSKHKQTLILTRDVIEKDGRPRYIFTKTVLNSRKQELETMQLRTYHEQSLSDFVRGHVLYDPKYWEYYFKEGVE